MHHRGTLPGRLITLEGGEGVGKSTQSNLLAEALRARGLDVVLSREPGGTPGAEAIRALLLRPTGEGWGPRAEALLFAAARADHVARVIRPALAGGAWVVCDRFIDSSRAYQANGVGEGGAGGLDDADILALHRIGSEGLLPDRTLLITAPDAILAARLNARDGARIDRIAGRGGAYHARVNAAFHRLAAAEPDRFGVIDGHQSPEDVHQAVMTSLAPLLAPHTPSL